MSDQKKPDDLTKTDSENIELTEEELGRVSGGSGFKLKIDSPDKLSPHNKVY